MENTTIVTLGREMKTHLLFTPPRSTLLKWENHGWSRGKFSASSSSAIFSILQKVVQLSNLLTVPPTPTPILTSTSTSPHQLQLCQHFAFCCLNGSVPCLHLTVLQKGTKNFWTKCFVLCKKWSISALNVCEKKNKQQNGEGGSRKQSRKWMRIPGGKCKWNESWHWKLRHWEALAQINSNEECKRNVWYMERRWVENELAAEVWFRASGPTGRVIFCLHFRASHRVCNTAAHLPVFEGGGRPPEHQAKCVRNAHRQNAYANCSKSANSTSFYVSALLKPKFGQDLDSCRTL